MKEGEGTPVIVAVDGMGPDAEVTINKAGGQQSQAPNAFHLVDPEVALDIIDIVGRSMTNLDTCQKQETMEAFKLCFDYMLHYESVMLIKAMQLIEPNMFKILQTVAGRLMYGITKGNNGKGYQTNNWRLIPREEHLNHAMNHMFAIIMGDTQDDHRSAVICRLHMALATKESRDFRYQEYVENVEPEIPVMDKIRNRFNDFKPTIKGDEMIGPGTGPMTNINFAQGELSPELKTKLEIMDKACEDFTPDDIVNYVYKRTANRRTIDLAKKCAKEGKTLLETLTICGMEPTDYAPGAINEFTQ